MYYESEGNIVVLPKGKLAVLRGMQDMIVVETDDVLLICPKKDEQQLRQVVLDVEGKFNSMYN